MIHVRTPPAIAVAVALGAALLLPGCSVTGGASTDDSCISASNHVSEAGYKASRALAVATQDVSGGAVYDTSKSGTVADDFAEASSQMTTVSSTLDDFAKVAKGDVADSAGTALTQWATIATDYQEFADAIRTYDVAKSKQVAGTMSSDLTTAQGSFSRILTAIKGHVKDPNPSFCG